MGKVRMNDFRDMLVRRVGFFSPIKMTRMTNIHVQQKRVYSPRRVDVGAIQKIRTRNRLNLKQLDEGTPSLRWKNSYVNFDSWPADVGCTCIRE